MNEDQPRFFDPETPVWETSRSDRSVDVATVAFVDGPDGAFDYIIPPQLRESLLPGARVLAPLGVKNRPVVAYCVGIETRRESDAYVEAPVARKASATTKPASKPASKPAAPSTPSLFDATPPATDPAAASKPASKPDAAQTSPNEAQERAPETKRVRLKELAGIVDKTPLLSPKALELGRWLAKRYLCPLGITLDGMLPAGVRDAVGSRWTSVCVLAPDAEARLKRLDAKTGKPAFDALSSKQQLVLNELRRAEEPPTPLELAKYAKCSTAPVLALKARGLIVMKKTKRSSKFYEDALASRKSDPRAVPLELNSDQRQALDAILDAIRNERNDVFLLHGVTGSGKTEVYIDAIEEVVSYGKQAIVLVPEISLTPQTVQRFCSRFHDVAILHSRLTELERKAEWEKIATGRAKVVVGARSAIFAPCPRLGLIVIDEEHETSFKQDVAPRYHARVVAKYRSEHERAPLILGSATPSLESWRAAQLGAYKLLKLPRRARDAVQPPIYAVDMRQSVAAGFTRGALCQRLCRDIEDALDADPTNQVVLLLNRRGYSTHIQCPSCGETLKCPDCDVALTHHINLQIALCHYCDYQIPAPKTCPYCGFAGIKYGGFGTQRLEQELCAHFPNAPILRMDSDTTQAKDAHERGFNAFRNGEYRILLGTQMIAKGLDFPNVVLVGIVNADVALHLPDYRASERVFDLVLQAAGRAGRGEKEGKVVVQTYYPDHPAIVAAINGDYEGFAANELATRRAMGYPPYMTALRFLARGPNENETAEFARTLADAMRRAIYDVNLARGYDLKNPPRVSDAEDAVVRDAQGRNAASLRAPRRPRPPLLSRVLGPAPAPFAKLRGAYRFHLQALGTPGDLLREAAEMVLGANLKKPRDVQWIVDVDPIDSL